MRISKLTEKYQATIPKEVREALHIGFGDRIVFEILPDYRVFIRKSTPLDLEYLKALESTLSEWSSENDEEAYRDL